MRKLIKRLLGATLSIAMIMALLPGASASAKAINKWETGTTSEFHVQKPDGDYLYKMQVSKDMLSYQVNMTNTETGETTLVIYDNGVATTYNIAKESAKDSNVEDKELVSVVDYNDSIELAEAVSNDFSVMSYRPMTACIIPTLGGNNLWYQMGNTSPDVGYMLIGCDWTYRVKADACDDCLNFRTKIGEANSLFVMCGLSNSAGIAVAVAVLLAGPTGGLSAAIAAGLVGNAAYDMVNACFAEESAHDSYDIAKGYGVRVQ